MKAFLICLLLVPMVNQGWELEENEGGIQVYSKEVPGRTLKATKSITVLNTTMDRMVQALTDPTQSINWMDRVASAEVIRRDSESTYWVHNLISLPWPMDDRDLVVKIEIQRSENRTVVKMSGDPKMIPEQEDYVRMPDYQGSWIIEDLGNGRIRVTNESFADVGGSIPEWLQGGVVDSALTTMENLKKYLRS